MSVTPELRDGVLVLLARADYVMTDLWAALDAGLAAAEGPGPVPVLCDLRESTAATERTGEDVRRSSEEFTARAPRISRVAALVGHDVVFGLMRMAEVFSERGGLELRTFRDPDAALVWLREGGK